MSYAFVLLWVLTGFLAVRLAWPHGLRPCRHDVLRLSLGAGLGLGLASLVAFIADAVFGGSAAFVIGADLLLFVAVAAACLVLRRTAPCPLCAHPAEPANVLPMLAAAVAATAAIAAFAWYTAANPYGEWDAWAIWNNHARFLASGPAWRQMFAPSLGWAVQDYPLLVPGAIANTWIAAGAISAGTPVLVAAVFLFASAGLLFGVLDLLRGRNQASLAVVALFGAAAIIRAGASQYADVPLGFFYLAAVAMTCLPDVLTEDRHSWWLAGAAAGCAAWTKNEGLVFVAVLLAARAFTAWRTRQFDVRRWALMLAGAVPFLAMALWFKVSFAPANYLFTEKQTPLAARLTDVSRYLTVAVEFGRQAFTFGGWLLPPVLVAVAYFWLMGKTERRGPGWTAASLALLLMTLAYAGVYVITTKDLNWQIETSLARVLTQLWPAAVLVFFLYVREPRPAAAAPEPAHPRQAARKTKSRTAR